MNLKNKFQNICHVSNFLQLYTPTASGFDGRPTIRHTHRGVTRHSPFRERLHTCVDHANHLSCRLSIRLPWRAAHVVHATEKD
jgi:hypothetical protein